jgi:hypothetical protein
MASTRSAKSSGSERLAFGLVQDAKVGLESRE